ncbi:hypothetical protein LEMLEM_LOCUS4190 [Lemmus lemmus]
MISALNLIISCCLVLLDQVGHLEASLLEYCSRHSQGPLVVKTISSSVLPFHSAILKMEPWGASFFLFCPLPAQLQKIYSRDLMVPFHLACCPK